MNRVEHLQWAKDRALELVETGNINEAFTSMMSDLKKHEELQDHSAIELGMMLLISGNLNDPRQMTDFIKGFN